MSAIVAAAKEISVDAAVAAVFTMKASHRLHRRLLEEDNMHSLALVIVCCDVQRRRERESGSKKMLLFSMTDTYVQLGGLVALF